MSDFFYENSVVRLRLTRLCPKLFLWLIFLLVLGCSSYPQKVSKAQNYLSQGLAQKAALSLKERAAEEGKDQVAFMLEYGLALHEAGEYEKSNDVFMKLDRLADYKDYVSLGRQAGSFLLNQSIIQYKSEKFENILINTYLALNFALLGNFDGALVECRRMNDKIHKMTRDGENPVKNFYALYLSGILWEAEENWDSSYISYLKAYEIKKNFSLLKKDLIRLAWKAQRLKDLKKWQKKFPDVQLSQIQEEEKMGGELVFIYQQGWIPKKEPMPIYYNFPQLVPRPSVWTSAALDLGQTSCCQTEVIYHVGGEAIRTLKADYGYLVAKNVLSFATKRVVADKLRKKNRFWGNVTDVFFYMIDQPDLRQWSTLLNTLQLSRTYLKSGVHKIKMYALGRDQRKWIGEKTLRIEKGKKVFLTTRTF